MSRSQYWTSKGNKRLLKRDSKGRIVDNQSYRNVARADQARKSKSELVRKVSYQLDKLAKELRRLAK